MPRTVCRATTALGRALASLALIGAVTGCGPSTESPSVVVAPGPSWTKADPSSPLVPGRCLGAWDGPDGASLVVLKSLPIPRGDAAGLGRELAIRLENLPQTTVVKSEKATIGGQDAARVEVIAPGFGDSLAPSGLGKPSSPKGLPLVPTHRVSVGFARPDGTYWIVCHYPESASAKLGPEVDAILKGGVTLLDRPAASY